jgi:hypothetical protein
MNSSTDLGIAYVELLLDTCVNRKTLWGIKTSSCQCIFCTVHCVIHYLKRVINQLLVKEIGIGGP